MYTATTENEKVRFHTLNRETQNRVVSHYVDSVTGKEVKEEDEVKGYQRAEDEYIILEDEELENVALDSTKTIDISTFTPRDSIEWIWLDTPYYLAPDKMGIDAFVLLRDGMKREKVAAIARTVLFRRMRTVLIRAHGKGLVANTLNFDYEVRSSEKAFEDMPDLKIEGEMLELAEHIIGTKKGSFDASTFDDRYEAAVAELVKAKIEGRSLPKKKAPVASKPSDLLQALRESAGLGAKEAKPKRTAANANKGVVRQKAAKPVAKSKPAVHVRRAG